MEVDRVIDRRQGVQEELVALVHGRPAVEETVSSLIADVIGELDAPRIVRREPKREDRGLFTVLHRSDDRSPVDFRAEVDHVVGGVRQDVAEVLDAVVGRTLCANVCETATPGSLV